MSSIIANIAVGVVILGLTALAVRALWKNHKRGGGCMGCSGGCAGCHGSCCAGTAKK